MKNLLRRAARCAVHVAAGMLALHLLVGPAEVQAQTWPDRLIRLVVPYGPGGGTDFTARLVADGMSKVLGHSVIVDNKPGAGSTLGTEYVAKSPPDGYTFLFTTSTFSFSAGLYETLRYDSIKDFTGVSLVATTPFVLVVHPSLAVNSASELISLARSKPGDLAISNAGPGSASHLAAALLAATTKTDLLQVPYKSGGQAVAAVVNGEVSATFASLDAVQGFIDGKRLRALAVSSPERLSVLPTVPTMLEGGVNYEMTIWYGILAPAGTPAAVTRRVSDAVAKVMQIPDAREKLIRVGSVPVAEDPERFTAYLRSDVEKWTKLIRQAGIKMN